MVPDWSQPTESDLAALSLVQTMLDKKTLQLYSSKQGMNETRIAEVIIIAPHALWYSQAKQWTTSPPDRLEPGLTRSLFVAGAQDLLLWVDGGYDAERKLWWPQPASWSDAPTGHLILLCDFFSMVEELRRLSLHVPSATFPLIADILLGPQWKKRYDNLLRSAEKAAS